MATVPSIASVVAGKRFLASMYNAIKTYLDFLIDTPHCDVWDSAGQTYTTGVDHLVLYNTESSDTDSMHSTASFTSRIVYNTAGRFDINIFVNLPTATYTTYDVNLRLNSGGSSGGGSSIRTWTNKQAAEDFSVNLSRVFTAGDYTEVFVTVVPTAVGAGTGGLYGTGFQARFIGNS